MSAKTDLHVHTCWCDGADTPAAVAEAALELGLETLGFSGHSWVPFDDCCMTPAGTEAYRAEVRRLQREYRGRMEIRLGVEQDFFSPASTEGYDYVIGSVHYLRRGDEYRAVDDTPEKLVSLVRDWFGGDWYAMAETYYDLAGRVGEVTGASIVGHFDLITKYNEKHCFFDEAHPRYRAAWQRAAERLLPFCIPFEVNTGAMSRGWRTSPYPSREICAWLKARGARLIPASDSHRKETLCYGFSELESLLS